MTVLFAALVVLGFLFHFLGSIPISTPARVSWSAIGWAAWLVASLLWAAPQLHA